MTFNADFPKGFHGSSGRHRVEYLSTDGKTKTVILKASSPGDAVKKVKKRRNDINQITHAALET